MIWNYRLVVLVGLTLVFVSAGCSDESGQEPVPDAEASVRIDSPDLIQRPIDPVSPGRNVLLIIADDLGTEYVPGYDNVDPSVQMPTIERLQAAGVTFTEAWANPECSPTRAGLYTGRHGSRNGIGSALTPRSTAGLDPTLNTALGRVIHPDIEVGLFGKWHLGEDSPYQPADHGFDYHNGFLAGGLATMGPNQDGLDASGNPATYYYWEHIIDGQSQGWAGTAGASDPRFYTTTFLVQRALDWIADRGSDRWLAVMAFNAPHDPFELPPVSCGYTETRYFSPACDREGCTQTQGDIRTYKAMIECMDQEIGVLLDGMDPDVLANTTVIFLGDNGVPGDVNEAQPTGHTKGTVYEGGVHVPFVVADGYALVNGSNDANTTDPGQVLRGGATEDAPIQSTDIFATLLTIFDAQVASCESGGVTTCGEDSESLIPYLAGAVSDRRTYALSELFDDSGYSGSFRVGDDKLVRHTNRGGSCYGLYDLSQDPQERDNLLEAGQAPGNPHRETARALITQARDVVTTAINPDGSDEFPDLEGATLCADVN